MGLLLKKVVGNGATLAVWQIVEPVDFFMQRLELQAVEKFELGQLKGKRRIEWLASRYLVHEMLTTHSLEDRVPLLKDEFGKPHLIGTEYELSFSHSHEMVAAILANEPTGIDIQLLVPKIEVLAKKFMRDEELASLASESRIAHMHYYWGAKESLYKAHGRRQLDFRQHILIEPFDYQDIAKTKGKVIKDDELLNFDVYFEKMGDYVLVYGLSI